MIWTSFRGKPFSDEDVHRAMDRFDREIRTTFNHWRKFTIEYNTKPYPPKEILRMVVGDIGNLSGGEPTNHYFRELHFKIGEISDKNQSASLRNPERHLAKILAPIPAIQDLIQKLFSQRWTDLHANYAQLEDAQYPGVYLLAYSEDDLEGKQLQEKQVFYVGMSHASIRKRLGQFIKGIEDGEHHSGASRFYKEYANRAPYSQLRKRKVFFVASIAIPCITRKDIRTPTDLMKMGEVARLELYALAHIKEKLHTEPELNKK